MRNYKVSYESVSRAFQGMRTTHPRAGVGIGVGWLRGSQKLLKHRCFVALACNHPNCLVLPFSLELIRLAAQPACKVIGWGLLPVSAIRGMAISAFLDTNSMDEPIGFDLPVIRDWLQFDSHPPTHGGSIHLQFCWILGSALRFSSA